MDHRSPGLLTVAGISLGLAACGGGGDTASSSGSGGTPAPTTYTIAVTVSGLPTGSTVGLQNNGGDALSAANGSSTFATRVTAGSAYAVTVATQPNGQGCTVSGGTGTVASSNVSSISVSCAALAVAVWSAPTTTWDHVAWR